MHLRYPTSKQWRCGGGSQLRACALAPRPCSTRAPCKQARATADDAGRSPLTVCSNAVQQLMQALSSSDQHRLDSILEYLPDNILDKCIEARKAQGSDSSAVSFEDLRNLLRTGDFSQTSELLFDSYAMRLLVLQTPRTATPLSSLMPTDTKSVHRVLVQSGTEEAVLTLNMELQEGLISQYRSAPKISSMWRLKSISGEASDATEVSSKPGPDVGPEMVVQAQLEALRQNNIAGVYSFASPRNKEATGPLERFNKLFEHPMYKPLLGLTKAESLRRVQMTHETYAEVVGVVSENTGLGRPGKFIYVWSVGRVLEEQSAEQAGWWMTNSVQLVSAVDGSV